MGQRIEYIKVNEFTPHIWGPQDLREEWPETADEVADDHLGLLVATSDWDGALLVGTVEELHDSLQQQLDLVIQHAKPGSRVRK